jgi:hypothetical protein
MWMNVQGSICTVAKCFSIGTPYRSQFPRDNCQLFVHPDLHIYHQFFSVLVPRLEHDIVAKRLLIVFRPGISRTLTSSNLRHASPYLALPPAVHCEIPWMLCYLANSVLEQFPWSDSYILYVQESFIDNRNLVYTLYAASNHAALA